MPCWLAIAAVTRMRARARPALTSSSLMSCACTTRSLLPCVCTTRSLLVIGCAHPPPGRVSAPATNTLRIGYRCSPADGAVTVGERAGRAVRAQAGQGDDRVGALGQGLRPAVAVEIG